MASIASTVSTRSRLLYTGGTLQQVQSLIGSSQGLWLDASDYNSMWQESTKATPVSGASQNLGYWGDTSGKGNHFNQATLGARPVTGQDADGRRWVAGDGLTKFMRSISNIDFTATDKVTIVVGLRKLADPVAGAMMLELNIGASAGSFSMRTPLNSGGAYFFRSQGSAFADATSSAFAAPHTAVLTGLGDISGDRATLRVNGVQAAQSTTDQGTSNYSSGVLYLMSRAGTSLFNSSRIYSIFIVGRSLSSGELSLIESITANKCGVTL